MPYLDESNLQTHRAESLPEPERAATYPGKYQQRDIKRHYRDDIHRLPLTGKAFPDNIPPDARTTISISFFFLCTIIKTLLGSALPWSRLMLGQGNPAP